MHQNGQKRQKKTRSGSERHRGWKGVTVGGVQIGEGKLFWRMDGIEWHGDMTGGHRSGLGGLGRSSVRSKEIG